MAVNSGSSHQRSAPIHQRHHHRQDDRENDAPDHRDVPAEEELHHDEDQDEDSETLQRLGWLWGSPMPPI